ncbi:hypothetical protein ABFV80_000492 [Vandammella animalimorsus]|uniref:hypothetical protein n=1 Tax=Vandammella animalimorsus TaxID=2029117 RepID=UPI00325A8A14
MIGLLFLGAGLAWLAFSCYMAVLVAKDAAIRQPFFKFLLGAVVLSVMLVGPFLDHVIGMRQFKMLCAERNTIHVTADANKVRRAKGVYGPAIELQNVFIPIKSWRATYIDLDTGEVFLSYEGLYTKGGQMARIILLGGEYSCHPSGVETLMNRLNMNKLLDEGRRS